MLRPQIGRAWRLPTRLTHRSPSVSWQQLATVSSTIVIASTISSDNSSSSIPSPRHSNHTSGGASSGTVSSSSSSSSTSTLLRHDIECPHEWQSLGPSSYRSAEHEWQHTLANPPLTMGSSTTMPWSQHLLIVAAGAVGGTMLGRAIFRMYNLDSRSTHLLAHLLMMLCTGGHVVPGAARPVRM
jgi:hypothetical protein